MTNLLALRWVTSWERQLRRVSHPADLRSLHRWLWRTWNLLGGRLAFEINSELRLVGDDQVRADIPHAFAGQLETAQIVIVNINPGWKTAVNDREDAIVRLGELESWEFCRSVFSRYPPEVAHMYWWNRMLGFAWRIAKGFPPVGRSALEKRLWANVNVGAIELLPLHSTSAGFLTRQGASPRLWNAIHDGMRQTLHATIRLQRPLTLVASKAGAAFTNELARDSGWPTLPVVNGLPAGTTAYRVGSSTIIAIPRQLVTKYSALAPDLIAAGVRSACGSPT
jgi:hypothetical protein